METYAEAISKMILKKLSKEDKTMNNEIYKYLHDNWGWLSNDPMSVSRLIASKGWRNVDADEIIAALDKFRKE